MWQNTVSLVPRSYVCGYCGASVGPDKGFSGARADRAVKIPIAIFVCSLCRFPTFFDVDGTQWPGVAYGAHVEALPDPVAGLYGEARRCMSVSAYTTATMACRKLLMNIAVERGAEGNKSFKYYVDWMVEHHYVPPGGDSWVDAIRGAGNEATHEIEVMDQNSARRVLSFVELLLKFVYEMPARVKATAEQLPEEPA